MKPSQAAFDIIRQWESISLRAYKATPKEKYYTIGYGHYSTNVQRGQVITKEVAEKLLREDVEAFAEKLTEFCPLLKQHQFDALCSLIFNVGWYNFRYSYTGEVARYCNYTRTPEEVAGRIVTWTRAKGEIMLGLQRRRIFEANYFLGYERFYLDENTHEIQVLPITNSTHKL